MPVGTGGLVGSATQGALLSALWGSSALWSSSALWGSGGTEGFSALWGSSALFGSNTAGSSGRKTAVESLTDLITGEN